MTAPARIFPDGLRLRDLLRVVRAFFRTDQDGWVTLNEVRGARRPLLANMTGACCGHFRDQHTQLPPESPACWVADCRCQGWWPRWAQFIAGDRPARRQRGLWGRP